MLNDDLLQYLEVLALFDVEINEMNFLRMMLQGR